MPGVEAISANAMAAADTAPAVLGVNYEGGKIVAHAESFDACVGVLNVQVAMDAPFQGAVAHEAVRAAGRSETQFPGYDAARLAKGVATALEEAANAAAAAGANHLVVQVARGRSADSFWAELAHLLPVAFQPPAGTATVVHGYRSSDYFSSPTAPFVAVNLGMFARLSDAAAVPPGAVFVPASSVDLQPRQQREAGWTPTTRRLRYAADGSPAPGSKCLPTSLPKCALLGLADDMPFVTPQSYELEALLAAFQPPEQTQGGAHHS